MRPHPASVPPEERTTAADALQEVAEPEPIVAEEPAVESESEPIVAVEPIVEATPIVEPVPEPEPEPETEPEPEPEPAPDAASVAEPAHELATEPTEGAFIAADDAFNDLVGATGSLPLPGGGRAALQVTGLRKSYGSTVAVDGIDLTVPVGTFFGVVGPNGAGKTTLLSMITGLLRPDAGTARVLGHDVWTEPAAAKRALGVLPDRLRLFDRLTGAQLLAYSGSLRGLDPATVRRRSADLATAFGLDQALGRPVSDYSLGMTKKIAIAAALLHAPRLLVLDEPFESVDPVSSANVLAVLRRFTEAGGTVLLSSHSMELIETACDGLAIIADGKVLAQGPTAEVLAGVHLEERFVELAGGRSAVEGMEWLHSYGS